MGGADGWLFYGRWCWGNRVKVKVGEHLAGPRAGISQVSERVGEETEVWEQAP